MPPIPTYLEMLTKVRAHLSDARDWLNSDWQPTTLTGEQAAARLRALRLIGEAKAAIDQAKRRPQ
ncbi:hypothetical protein AB0J71_31825 [Nonomuraea sp. NPDC049637]|uniref:hypothetical protein n=1 Tax=Nonomuraea sp. NPDC049637 TaxID=3154356 RepID=UPI00343569E3